MGSLDWGIVWGNGGEVRCLLLFRRPIVHNRLIIGVYAPLRPFGKLRAPQAQGKPPSPLHWALFLSMDDAMAGMSMIYAMAGMSMVDSMTQTSMIYQ